MRRALTILVAVLPLGTAPVAAPQRAVAQENVGVYSPLPAGGVQERLNTQRFGWEANPAGLPLATPTWRSSGALPYGAAIALSASQW